MVPASTRPSKNRPLAPPNAPNGASRAFLCSSSEPKNRPHCFQHLRMILTIGNDDPFVALEPTPQRKVQWFTINIGYGSSGSLNDPKASCMIPNSLYIPRLRRKPQINGGIPSSNSSILALTINAIWLCGYAQTFGNLERMRVRGMGFLYRFTNAVQT